MKHHIALRSAAAAALLGGALIAAGTVGPVASASTTQFGTLSNFDVFNDTGGETHGFEIELDGISSADVTYKFGAPYERYGDPIVQSIPGGVKVIYASPYDTVAKRFTQGTPVAPTPITATAGHQCWTGGAANYPTAGCEHFGLGLTASPTAVVYDWLVADPANAGKLIAVSGGGVPIPAPMWSATPAAPNNPNHAPVVAAAVQAPDPEAGQQLGDAIWVKVFMRQSPKAADLGHLLSGDSKVPSSSSEVETEWLLIQGGVGGGLQADLTDNGQMGAKSESVTRRYQFFGYTGPYDPESHEATPINDSMPSAGELGNLIGNQMAALNLAPGGKVPADLIAPKVRLLSGPPTSSKSSTAAFAFRATDNLSRTFSWYCSLDKRIPTKCASTYTLRNLKVGRHVLKVYAADAARNPSRPLTFTWSFSK